jgi:hypothetical protein
MRGWLGQTWDPLSLAMCSSEQQTSTPASTTESEIGNLSFSKDQAAEANWVLSYRENCFETTLVHLTERFNGKEVYLVGTMNQSTMLAQRTKKLIEELKPDTVLVQASES